RSRKDPYRVQVCPSGGSVSLRQGISVEDGENVKERAKGRGGRPDNVIDIERPDRRLVADDLRPQRSDDTGVLLEECRWDVAASNARQLVAQTPRRREAAWCAGVPTAWP